jgi:hypothetical protein
MSNPVLVAVISGLASGVATGIASGALTSSIYIRRAQNANAVASGSQAGTGRQVAQVGGGGSAVNVRGRHFTLNAAGERPARLSASVRRSGEPGLPRQVLILRNIGDRSADELVVRAGDGDGRFVAQPDWHSFPHHLSGGQHASVPCRTTGAGYVTMTVQFVDAGSLVGPIYLEAAHE